MKIKNRVLKTNLYMYIQINTQYKINFSFFRLGKSINNIIYRYLYSMNVEQG